VTNGNPAQQLARGVVPATPADNQHLSVAEIQQALRELRGRGEKAALQDPDAHSRQRGTAASALSEPDRSDVDPAALASRGDVPPGLGRTGGDSRQRTAWVAVAAAHAGAGASTVALALSEAAAVTGRRAHLVESADPSRSGLVAGASEELGLDPSGAWRCGLRSGVAIARRATERPPDGWPAPPAGDGQGVTVVDLGLVAAGNLDRLVGLHVLPVIVCRPTVPGVRLTEHLLDLVAGAPPVVAAVGPSRWPGEVTATLGPRLRALRGAGHVVAVPWDRRLEITGLTPHPLPKPVHAAGRALLALLDSVADPDEAREAATSPVSTRGRKR
jgi:hypothetical protein